MEDVAVLHYVILAFQSELAGVARTGFAGEGDVIVISDGLGADEALLEIGVDDARGLRGAGALGYRPGARLLGAGGEIGDEAKELVAFPDEAVEPRFFKPELGEIGLALFGGKLGEFGLDLGRDDDAAGAFGLGESLDPRGVKVAGRGGGFVDVAHIEHGFRGEETEAFEGGLLLLAHRGKPSRL